MRGVIIFPRSAGGPGPSNGSAAIVKRLLTATDALGPGLLQPDGIATADSATLEYRGIDPNISPVVLGGSAQNAGILREIALSERRHHAARAGACDTQANGIPDRDSLPNPSILYEILLPVCSLDHDIRAKPSNLEPPLRIQTS